MFTFVFVKKVLSHCLRQSGQNNITNLKNNHIIISPFQRTYWTHKSSDLNMTFVQNILSFLAKRHYSIKSVLK